MSGDSYFLPFYQNSYLMTSPKLKGIQTAFVWG